MGCTHNGLEFEVTQDATIPFLGRDMTKFNKQHPHEHYETYHFSIPSGEAGFIAIQVVESAKALWIHEIEVNDKVLEQRKDFGSSFLHYALKELEKLPNIQNYTIRLNGVTDDGKEFFNYYGVLSGINYSKLITKLEEKI
ncbi:MAG: hypothetical protein KKF50_05575 [Nanoarchaeota archaeon]|nr:hypothetical protein [Nanoarchaeota archaeon]